MIGFGFKTAGRENNLMNVADDHDNAAGVIPKLLSGKLAGKPYIQLVNQVKPLLPDEFPWSCGWFILYAWFSRFVWFREWIDGNGFGNL